MVLRMVSVVLIALTIIVTVVVFFYILGEDIPSKLLSTKRDLTEAFFVEINLYNKKK